MPTSFLIIFTLFQSNRFSYVPRQAATNNTRVQLHDHSLNVLPLLSFNNKTLQDLDDLYSQLDGEVTIQLRDIHHNIAKLQPVTTTTLNDALKYLALSFNFSSFPHFHCLVLITCTLLLFQLTHLPVHLWQ